MRNPFEQVAKPKPQEQYFDVEESRLGCKSCGEVVTEGKWYPVGKILVWSCSKGHESKIEGIDL